MISHLRVDFLRRGLTIAAFKQVGTNPSTRDWFIILVIVGKTWSRTSLSSRVGTGSKQQDFEEEELIILAWHHLKKLNWSLTVEMKHFHLKNKVPVKLPNGNSPDGFSPYGFSPDGFSPYGFSPGGFSPYGLSPEGFSPDEMKHCHLKNKAMDQKWWWKSAHNQSLQCQAQSGSVAIFDVRRR